MLQNIGIYASPYGFCGYLCAVLLLISDYDRQDISFKTIQPMETVG